MPIGRLADVWSRKWIIITGIALWSAATAACGLARSFSHLLLARIGVGAGEAALAPAGYSIITDITPRENLGAAISVFQMGSLIGAGLAFLLGGGVYAVFTELQPDLTGVFSHFSAWQLTFFALATPGPFFVLLLMLIREPQRKKLANASTSPENGSTLIFHLKENAALYGALFTGCACLVAISYAFASWAPAILTREFGWAVGTVGMRIGLVMLSTAPAGVLLGGLLADYWTRRGKADAFGRVLVLAAIIVMPVMLALFMTKSGAFFYILFGIAQFSTGMAIGVGPATTQKLADAHLRGQVSAIYVFGVNLVGLGAGPVAVGVLSDQVFSGDNALLSSLATYCLLMCGISFVLLSAFRKMLFRRSAAIAS
ncbi:MAG: MFS transporter [Parvularculaceae bacterium]